MTNPFAAIFQTALQAGHEFAAPVEIPVTLTNTSELPSLYRVTDFACASIAAAATQCAQFQARSDAATNIDVSQRLASLWFRWSLQPQGWSTPDPWDPVAGDYQCKDGWIKLHTNAPRHQRAALTVLDVAADRVEVTKAVANWRGCELESAIIGAGGCAAELRSEQDWAVHPQGRAVAAEPLVAWDSSGSTIATPDAKQPRSLPLTGIRVLDLTRILAGPVATRFLAYYGADVLRIDPPNWHEPAVVPEVTLGKRCAGLDLKVAADRKTFESLLRNADVLVHGYRPGALDALGYSRDELLQLNPALIESTLCAYGWTGPWSQRRGFDSLVQMSSGIAHTGMVQTNGKKPKPLPVQALDHATGYLLAAATVRALNLRATTGVVLRARLSLARTGLLLADERIAGPRRQVIPEGFERQSADDVDPAPEATSWGPARRLRFPVQINTADGPLTGHWPHPARQLRSSPAEWTSL